MVGSMRAIEVVLEQLVIHPAVRPTAIPPHGDRADRRLDRGLDGARARVEPHDRVVVRDPDPDGCPDRSPSQFGPLAPVGPTMIAFPTSLVAWSTGSTLPPWTSATQTPSAVARTPFGAKPAAIWTTSRVTGSTRASFAVVQLVAQIAAAFAAMPL